LLSDKNRYGNAGKLLEKRQYYLFDTKFSLCYKFSTEDEKDLLAGYAGGELVYRQAGMILGWGEMEISKKTRFLPLIKLWVCCNHSFPPANSSLD
jgi:hypothetical protein